MGESFKNDEYGGHDLKFDQFDLYIYEFS